MTEVFTVSTPGLPCPFEVDVSCCSEWDTYNPDIQTAAMEYGALTIWAATGRRFGLCSRTVRPCGQQATNVPSGYYWGEGTWFPYIFNGVWRNCTGCLGSSLGCCTCEPDCQVWLEPPVYWVDLVTVSGSVVATGAWRVDNGQWLVRTDGTCWPTCQDFNVDAGNNTMFVTYRRGLPQPAVLARAAGELACEWARSCVGSLCRLPQRVTSIARQGVSISLADAEAMLRNGLTGINTVDQVITRLNPYGLVSAMKVASPDLPITRQVTQP